MGEVLKQINDYIALISNINTKLDAIKIALLFDNNDNVIDDLLIKIYKLIKFNNINSLLCLKNNTLKFYIFYNKKKYIIKNIEISYFFDINGGKTYNFKLIKTDFVNKFNELYSSFNELNNYVQEYKLIYQIINKSHTNKYIEKIVCNLYILETIYKFNDELIKYYVKKCIKYTKKILNNQYSKKIVFYLNSILINDNSLKNFDEIIIKVYTNLILIICIIKNQQINIDTIKKKLQYNRYEYINESI